MKKLLSVMVALVLALNLCGEVFAYGYAQDYVTQYPQYNSDYEISGTNAFGSMMADAVNNKLNEQQENAGYNVFSVEITGQTATVELETLCDSTVVIGIYDEQGVNLLMTASASVTPNDEYVTVTFDQYLPQYFFIKAYLIDSATLRPLCTVYDCPNYTQEMQEFFSKTVYDFKPEKVLNLDSDVTNNFAVYSDTVTVIPRVDGINTLVFQGDGTYVFANADENIRNLQPNQIFSYEYASGEVIIAKVAAVTENPDGTVTVSEQDAELEDAFEYIKIDAAADLDDATIDDSDLGDEVVYVGEHYSTQQSYTHGNVAPLAFEGGDSEKKCKEYKLEFKDETDVTKISSTVSLSLCLEASIKYYVSWSYQYIEARIHGSVYSEASFEVVFSKKIELGHFSFNIVPKIVILNVTPELILEASAHGTIIGTYEATFGARASSDKGVESLKSSHGELRGDAEARFYVGLSLTPSISIINEKIASMTLNGTIGAEVKAKMSVHFSTDEPSENVYHECHACLEGSVNVLINGYFNVKLLNCNKLSYTLNFPSEGYYTIKICDFYSSADFGDSGFGTCPHYVFNTFFWALDEHGQLLPGVRIELSNGEVLTTDENGVTKRIPLKVGEYTAICFKEGYRTISSKFVIDLDNVNKVCGVYINMQLSGSELLPDGSKRVKQVSLGGNHSAALTADGGLYMWGENLWGQLGNSSVINRTVPIKVMDYVASVSLGGAQSSAITEDGSLYMWGNNDWGQLGNGTTKSSGKPVKIMDNIASISVGYYHCAAIDFNGNLYTWGGNNYNGRLGTGTLDNYYIPNKIMSNVISAAIGGTHSAAITVDGSLYMWGGNDWGQLGNDSTNNSSIPIKIMDNVVYASLGSYDSAAITTDGSLYMWGANYSGNFGNGTTKNSPVPIKIMDNVASISLGGYHSAAITTDGSLYMCGDNYYGQLGNGTTEDSSVPRKIMDNVAFVSLGWYHSAAITTDGSLYMWGRNAEGQLGNGTREDSSVPIKISIPADNPSPTLISTLSALPMAVEETSPTVGAFTDLIPNEIYNIYALRSRTAAEPLAASNLLYIAQATSDAVGNLTYNCELLEDCPNPIIFCKAMSEFDLENAQISAADVTHDSITVKWDAYPSADMYRVYRVVNGIYLELGTTAETSFTVSELSPNREYGFLVSCRVNGEWSYPSPDDVAYIATAAEPYTLGDVNNDGEVNLDDAVLALQKAMKVDVTSTVFIDEAADVNGDGEINLDDAVEILKIAMKVEQ